MASEVASKPEEVFVRSFWGGSCQVTCACPASLFLRRRRLLMCSCWHCTHHRPRTPHFQGQNALLWGASCSLVRRDGVLWGHGRVRRLSTLQASSLSIWRRSVPDELVVQVFPPAAQQQEQGPQQPKTTPSNGPAVLLFSSSSLFFLLFSSPHPPNILRERTRQGGASRNIVVH